MWFSLCVYSLSCLGSFVSLLVLYKYLRASLPGCREENEKRSSLQYKDWLLNQLSMGHQSKEASLWHCLRGVFKLQLPRLNEFCFKQMLHQDPASRAQYQCYLLQQNAAIVQLLFECVDEMACGFEMAAMIQGAYSVGFYARCFMYADQVRDFEAMMACCIKLGKHDLLIGCIESKVASEADQWYACSWCNHSLLHQSHGDYALAQTAYLLQCASV